MIITIVMDGNIWLAVTNDEFLILVCRDAMSLPFGGERSTAVSLVSHIP